MIATICQIKFGKQISLTPCLAKVSHTVAKGLEDTSSFEIAKGKPAFITLILLLKHKRCTTDTEILL